MGKIAILVGALLLMQSFVRAEAAAQGPRIAANDAKFNYYGRWSAGPVATTMTNGAQCEFGISGDGCTLRFDTSAKDLVLPIIAYWIDDQGPVRAALDVSGRVVVDAASIKPGGLPAAAIGKSKGHRVRFMANIYSGYPVRNNDWTTLRDAVKFQGVELAAGQGLLAVPYEARQIEFLGDSITASLRLLYATNKVDTPVTSSPETNWTEETARALGLRAVVNGHGGQGITTGSTDGAPTAEQAFGRVYQGVKWQPETKPGIVVVYQGTNDGGFTAAAYQKYLATIRKAYPQACIFAVVPFGKSNHVAAIQGAVAGLRDGRMFFLDYSKAFTVATDTSDGLHFNPAGSAKMATRLSADILKAINAAGIRLGTTPAAGATQPATSAKSP